MVRKYWLLRGQTMWTTTSPPAGVMPHYGVCEIETGLRNIDKWVWDRRADAIVGGKSDCTVPDRQYEPS